MSAATQQNLNKKTPPINKETFMQPTKPDYHSYEEFQNRSRKLKELRELGIEPYPHKYNNSHTAHELQAKYPDHSLGHSEDAEQGKTPSTTIAGRLVLFRAMGKNAFGQVQDHTGRLQIMFNRDNTKIEGYTPDTSKPEHLTPLKLIEKMIDLGDIIGIEGNLFYTNKGELTIYAKKVTLLSKSLLPLADKHSGLAEKEIRYRKRWLDLISNPDTQKLFRQRSQIITSIRKYMDELGYLEVETPILQSIYGGAEARPFETKLNALDQDMFMRISLEIPLKKLIVGGMDKVYELSHVFRNEGIDRTHNPEFTMIEAYAAYTDYNDMMKVVENLFERLALELYGTTIIPAKAPDTMEDIVIDVKAPWIRLSMKDAIKKYGKYDVDSMSEHEMSKILLNSGHVAPEKLKTMNKGLLIAAMFEVFAESHLIMPHHIIDHPVETTPLCKLHRNPELKKQGIIERFESFILSREVCNAYTELNDPEIQRQLLELQAQRKEAGDDEASPLDEEFLEAICQGMPPTGGFGIGIDRLVMILTNNHSIRDILYFPWMKPKKNNAEEEETPTT
jgi:lysyl-tRNA synthetase class 2